MSELPAEVLEVLEVLNRALGVTDELSGQSTQDFMQRWIAGPIAVLTSGYGPDPTGYSGGQQTWIIEIDRVSFALAMSLHDFGGWSTPLVLTTDPRQEPILDALVGAGIRFGLRERDE